MPRLGGRGGLGPREAAAGDGGVLGAGRRGAQGGDPRRGDALAGGWGARFAARSEHRCPNR